MSKRLTDTEKWNDAWFRKLSPLNKLVWIYLCDQCDHAGIWKVDRETVDFYIGAKIDWPAAEEALTGRVEKRSGEYWFIKKFLPFQYGKTLTSGDAAKSAVSRVVDLGFKESLEGVLGESLDSLGTPKAKAKAIAMAKAVGKEERVLGGEEKPPFPKKRFTPPTPREVTAYAASIGFRLDGEKFCAHYEARGWKPKGYSQTMTSWKAAVRTWRGNDFGGNHAPDDSTGDPRNTPLARRALEAQGLRKANFEGSAKTLLAGMRDRSADETQTHEPDGARNKPNVGTVERIRTSTDVAGPAIRGTAPGGPSP